MHNVAHVAVSHYSLDLSYRHTVNSPLLSFTQQKGSGWNKIVSLVTVIAKALGILEGIVVDAEVSAVHSGC